MLVEKEDQYGGNLHAVKIPEWTIVSNKQESQHTDLHPVLKPRQVIVSIKWR
jgi:hypothetical protein